MKDIYLQIALMAGLGTMVFLFARAVPRVHEHQEGEEPLPYSKFDKWLASLPLEKVDALVNVLIEKMLRKFKIWVLKADNLVTKYLKRVRKVQSGNGKGGSAKVEEIKGMEGSEKEEEKEAGA